MAQHLGQPTKAPQIIAMPSVVRTRPACTNHLLLSNKRPDVPDAQSVFGQSDIQADV